MTDLDALKEDLAHLRERGDLVAALTATTAELYRLIEEVERLRAEVDAERAAVVAFLHAEAQRMYEAGQDRPAWFVLENRAEAIERGEHRREEGA